MSPIPTKQVRIEPGGLWHRYRDDRKTHTACGEPIPGHCEWTRAYKLDALICYRCFTRHEIETGEHDALAKEDAQYPDELPRSKRPSTEDRTPMRRRVRDTELDIDLHDTAPDLPPGPPAAQIDPSDDDS